MPQDEAKSIPMKLVNYSDGILNLYSKSLRENICDVEVFDVLLSQYFSGFNLLDTFTQTPFESDSFQDFGCASLPKLKKIL